MLWWIVIFIILYIFILFKYIFLFNAQITYYPQFLPNFILNRLTDLNNNSFKPELKNILIKKYCRIVLFYFLIAFLYTLLLIYTSNPHRLKKKEYYNFK